MSINGVPVICHTISVFLSAFPETHIILVLPEAHLDLGQQLIKTFFPSNDNIQIVIGGPTRFHSVQEGIKKAESNSIIFVHDAVRCLLTKKLIHRLYEATLEKGNAIPMMLSKDSVRFIDEKGNKTIDRNQLALIQTPQVFKGSILLNAFNKAYHERFTDEASVVEADGVIINLIEGEENNIKITQPIDLIVAEQIIKQSNQ
jgi:2-C-methyl-D-erythritol 4-phosphate cytidylyltransferase